MESTSIKKPTSLTKDERDRRWRKVRGLMEKRGLDCLIGWGSLGCHSNLCANLRYLSNTAHEGYLVFPLNGEPSLFTFMGRKVQTSWVVDQRCGHPDYAEAISERLKEINLTKAHIGMVGPSKYYREMGFPYPTYLSIIENFSEYRFEDATDIVDQARMIKSPAEISCLERGCETGEKVIQIVRDTVMPGMTDNEARSLIMDTLVRNGCESFGILLFCSGKELTHAGQGGGIERENPRTMQTGDIILTEFDAKYIGYQAQFNQAFALGKPASEWLDIVNIARESFYSGLKTLKPGITVGELDKALLSPILEAGYTYSNPAFHGLGLTLEEPMGTFPMQPGYKSNTSFRFEPGMVIEFEPQVITSDHKKGLSIGCPVLVTETRCRLLSQNWKLELLEI